MVGWEEDDLDEIIDQALTTARQDTSACTKEARNSVMEKEGWSGDEMKIVFKDEPGQEEISFSEGHEVVDRRNSQIGWDDEDIELDINSTQENTLPEFPELSKNLLPEILGDSFGGQLHAYEGDHGPSKDKESPSPDFCLPSNNFLEQNVGRIETSNENLALRLDSAHLMDGWNQDNLEIAVSLDAKADPSLIKTSNQEGSTGPKTTTLNGISWEEDNFDLDNFGQPDQAAFNHDELNSGQEIEKLQGGKLDNVEGKHQNKIEHEDKKEELVEIHEIRPALLSPTNGGWEDDTIDIEEDFVSGIKADTIPTGIDKVKSAVVEMNRCVAATFTEDLDVTAASVPVKLSSIVSIAPPVDFDKDSEIKAGEAPVSAYHVTASATTVTHEHFTPDAPADMAHQDFAHHRSDIPDSPLPISEKAPSGWQNDEFELDFSDNRTAEQTEEEEMTQEKEPAEESDLMSEQFHENLYKVEQSNSDVIDGAAAPETMIHPSISMGWLDEDLDIPDFPSMNPLMNPETHLTDSEIIKTQAEDPDDHKSEREGKTVIEDEFPTEQKLGWEDSDLDLSEGDDGWASDDIKIAPPPTKEDAEISPEDFFGAYTSKPDMIHDPFDQNFQEHSYPKHNTRGQEADEEPELTSPTQWFSGVLKTIGSDLKSKTTAGLDKLYEALDTVPERSGTSSVPASEESANKFKGILDQLSPTTTVVGAVEVAEEKMYVASDPEEMSVTDGEGVPADDKFKGLFDTIRPSADDHLGGMMGKIGQTTYSLASHTKNKLTPAMQDFASKLKKKITDMPKRRLKRGDLDADVRRLLFREPEAMEALESIQVAACKNSIELKRMRKAGRTIAPLFRDDPTMATGQSAFQLDSLEGWSSFESSCCIEFPLSHKVEMTRLLLLARNSADSMMEIYSSLDSAPETLDYELYLAIRLFSYRQIMADFTRLSLELLAMISTAAREDLVSKMITTLLSELDLIKSLAQQSSEDIPITFPELDNDVITSSLSVISERLNTQPLLSIIREVYYAYEPIVAFNTLK